MSLQLDDRPELSCDWLSEWLGTECCWVPAVGCVSRAVGRLLVV